ncbi:hypothetical protein A9Q91_00825 [Candidatus Gracilibacteria bacterium 28_42_T64]|nr:hypothetical protein A9Q91_00825 [Candidatus Gracilibacteria bacterium 28_42_T64]
MSVQNQNNKIISYLIIFVSLFILFLFTKDQYLILQEKSDLKESYVLELQEKKETLDSLNKIKNELKKDESITKRYLNEINEDEIIEYFYSYSERGTISIKNISLGEGKVNELGFIESKINVSARVENEAAMKEFLNFLITPGAKYNFFIESFSYPKDGREGSFNVNVPLKLFYK